MAKKHVIIRKEEDITPLNRELIERVCKKCNLKPAPISTQVVQRDRHAEYLSALAITASSIDKFPDITELPLGISSSHPGAA